MSVFGVGFGESIVIHCGDGSWMVVDSCLGEDRSVSAAEEYLRSIGVDIAKSVRWVVVTHWHDDHIRGLDSLIRKAKAAKIIFSTALQSEELAKLVAGANQVKTLAATNGASTFREVISILQNRAGDRRSGPDIWAQSGQMIVETQRCSVQALSPSSQTITDSHMDVADKLSGTKRVRAAQWSKNGPNHRSVVLRVRSKASNVLLGADLEVSGSSGRGWEAVVENHSDSSIRCGFFKVPHHGSANGDLDSIWTEMLGDSNPVAVVTPFHRGNVSLPKKSDVTRIREKTNAGYITAWPALKRPDGLSRPVLKTVAEVSKSHRKERSKPGHVRYRAESGTSYDGKTFNIELSNGAQPLAAVR